MANSFQPLNITTNTTTVVKAGPAVLHAITLNTAGAAPNTIKLYNHPSSATNLFATIDGTATLASPFLYDVSLSNGLTIVTASGTCADFTVSFE